MQIQIILILINSNPITKGLSSPLDFLNHYKIIVREFLLQVIVQYTKNEASCGMFAGIGLFCVALKKKNIIQYLKIILL
jgi:hypothetical protein